MASTALVIRFHRIWCRCIDAGDGKPGRHLQPDYDGGGDVAFAQGLLDHARNVDHGRIRRLGAHGIQQVGHDAIGIRDLVLNDAQVFLRGLVRIAQHGLQVIHRVAHHPQRVAQFMPHGVGHLAQHGQFFRAHLILLRRQQLPGTRLHLFLEPLVLSQQLRPGRFKFLRRLVEHLAQLHRLAQAFLQQLDLALKGRDLALGIRRQVLIGHGCSPFLHR
jgi:hypothetical protein